MDYTLYEIINGIAGKSHFLDLIMINIAQYFPFLILVILVILWFIKDTAERVLNNRKGTIFASITMLIAVGINHIIGSLYFRPRPYAHHNAHLLISPSVDPSFPSDHATFAFALAFPILATNKKIGTIMLLMAVLLAFSRVYVGIHYPLDVIGGALIAYLTYKLYRRYPILFNFVTNAILTIWDKITRGITRTG